MEVRAFVQLEVGAPDADVRALRELFREVGVDAEISPGVIELSQAPSWLFMINVAFASFIVKLVQLTTEVAYVALKDFIRRAVDAHGPAGGHTGAVEIHAQESPVRIYLRPELSDEAYRALVELNFTDLPAGILGWEPERRKWFHDSLEGKRELG